MPFLRLIIPCITGIIISFHIYLPYLHWVVFISGLVLIPFFLFCKNHYTFRYFSGLSFNCLLFAFSSMLTHQALNKAEWNYPVGVYSYKVKILEDPVPKERTYQYIIQIKTVKTGESETSINKNAILYLPKDSLSGCLVAGNYLTVNASFKKQENSTSSSFNYSNYLKIKGYACTGYAKSGEWKQMEPFQPRFYDIKSHALACRRYFLKKLHQIVPDNTQFGVASGVLFGYKNALDDNLKMAFSTTGGAHVLAVSGLHVGILYAALLFPFLSLGNGRKAKCLRQLIVLSLMWTFAFITGLTPSVVRATTMLSLYGLADITKKRIFTLNIVGASAFLMLIYNPLYLFDVGFQLSFAAVIAIIAINPLLQKLYQPNNYAINYVWSLTTVSISAQIGTMPLTIYYFNQFPVVFLLTNLFVIPIVGILLVMLLIYLSLACLVTLPEFTLYPLRILLQIFISGVEFIASIPYAYISGLHISITDAVSLYLLIFLLTMLLIYKKIVFVYRLFLLGLFQLIHYL